MVLCSRLQSKKNSASEELCFYIDVPANFHVVQDADDIDWNLNK